jgi:hypothetical protein
MNHGSNTDQRGLGVTEHTKPSRLIAPYFPAQFVDLHAINAVSSADHFSDFDWRFLAICTMRQEIVR